MRDVIARAHELVREGSEDRQPLYDCIEDLLSALNSKIAALEEATDLVKFEIVGTSVGIEAHTVLIDGAKVPALFAWLKSRENA